MSELGCLREFELEVKFKPEARLIFCKPKLVPLAILDELNDAFEEGIRKGVWKPTDFSAYGTLWFQYVRQSVLERKWSGSGSAGIIQ